MITKLHASTTLDRILGCRGRLHAAMLLVAASLPACQGQESGTTDTARGAVASDSAGATKSLDACALLTQEEVATVVGSPVGEPQRYDNKDAYSRSQCTYAGPRGAVMLMVEYPRSTRATTSAELARELEADVAKNKASSAEFAQTFGDAKVQPLEGVGVPAAYYDLTRSARQIWVDAIKNSGGGHALRVQVGSSAGLDAAKSITQKAAARLP